MKQYDEIRKENYTKSDFLTFIEKVQSPFHYVSSDGLYSGQCNGSETTCINAMAMKAIDGVLCQKRAASELSRLDALERKRKEKK